MMLPLARLLADSTAALGHLGATELVLAAFELGIDVVALALVGAILRRTRPGVGEATDLDEAA